MISHEQISIRFTVTMNHLIIQARQPKPSKQLVESAPVQEGAKLYQKQITWKDLRGLF